MLHGKPVLSSVHAKVYGCQRLAELGWPAADTQSDFATYRLIAPALVTGQLDYTWAAQLHQGSGHILQSQLDHMLLTQELFGACIRARAPVWQTAYAC